MNKLAEELKNILELSEKKLKTLDEQQSSVKPLPNKWSAKEILGHLVDSSINNSVRFVTGQFKDNMIFSGYEHEKWVLAQDYQNAGWDFIISLWKMNNSQICRLINNMPEEIIYKQHKEHSLDQIAWKEIDKSVPASMEYLINDYIGHMKHHLNQIFRMHKLNEI